MHTLRGDTGVGGHVCTLLLYCLDPHTSQSMHNGSNKGPTQISVYTVAVCTWYRTTNQYSEQRRAASVRRTCGVVGTTVRGSASASEGVAAELESELPSVIDNRE